MAQRINNIAATPSLMGKLNHKLHLTLDDLKEIPPARRFDFVRTVYEPILKHYTGYQKKSYWSRGYGRYRKVNGKVKDNAQNIAISLIRGGFGGKNSKWAYNLSVDNLSVKDMESLLFAVTVRKNDEVTEWLDAYKEYLSKKKDIKKLLEGVMNWL